MSYRTETPTVRNLDLARLWRQSQANVARRWGGSGYDLSDLQSLASEAFVEFVNGYDAWCATHSADPTNEGLFFTLAKKRVHWTIITEVNALHRDLPLPEDDNSETRTQLRVLMRDSTLHHKLVDRVRALKLSERVMLALVCFEEIPVGEVADMLGVRNGAVSRITLLACERVMLSALNETLNERVVELPEKAGKWKAPDSLVDWVIERYGTDIDTYLQYVEIHYDADVSYLIEMLDRANRRGPERGNKGNNRKLTPEQVEEIKTRLLGDERHEDIAKDYNVGRSAISRLNAIHGRVA